MRKKRFSDALVDDALAVFQRRSGRPLSRADAVHMLEDLTGFFLILHEADRAPKARIKRPNDPPRKEG